MSLSACLARMGGLTVSRSARLTDQQSDGFCVRLQPQEAEVL